MIISATYAAEDTPVYLVVDSWEKALALALRDREGLLALYWLSDGYELPVMPPEDQILRP